MLDKNKKLIIILTGLLIVLVVLAGIVYWQENKYLDKLQVVFLDVGQGDAIYIRTPAGHDVLIDGGPDNKVVDQLGRRMPFWDRRIELIILTHPDADHVTGLVEVIKRYEVREVLYTGVEHASYNYESFEKIINEKDILVKFAQAGQVYDLGDGILLEVIYPFENLHGQEIKPANDGSIVLLLDYNEIEFLFTGDLEKAGEKEIVSHCKDQVSFCDKLDVEVLKVGHHGSNSSSTKKFLELVSPKYSVIQSGFDNKFGHPRQEILDKLEAIDSQILRNDQLGVVGFISDGINYDFLIK